MAEFDYNYLSQLVEQTQMGSSAAFAELYAATYQKQYYFACRFLGDETLAKDALQEIYINALRNIDHLQHPRLFISWLNQISFKTCYKMQLDKEQYENRHKADGSGSSVSENDDPEMQTIGIDGRDYILKQIMTLPLSEAQAITFKYVTNMSIGEIAKMMDTSRSSVKRYISSGKERLDKVLQR